VSAGPPVLAGDPRVDHCNAEQVLRHRLIVDDNERFLEIARPRGGRNRRLGGTVTEAMSPAGTNGPDGALTCSEISIMVYCISAVEGS
jgi:hypothetical protein